MGISIKKIGGRQYAYTAYRRGDRIVQQYIGPAKDPAVAAKIAAAGKGQALPAHVYPLFWDVDPHTLHVRRHSRYIIERILDVGGVEALWWAQRQYPTALIIEVCLTSRRLSERSKIFWSIWFGEEHAS